MHGIHHSLVREETNSNWTSGLTLWDRLHGTLCLDVPQDEVEIGLPAYRNPEELSIAKLLTMPFARQRPSWEFPRHGRSLGKTPSLRPIDPLSDNCSFRGTRGSDIPRTEATIEKES